MTSSLKTNNNRSGFTIHDTGKNHHDVIRSTVI